MVLFKNLENVFILKKHSPIEGQLHSYISTCNSYNKCAELFNKIRRVKSHLL
jgi:hypothetical protein